MVAGGKTRKPPSVHAGSAPNKSTEDLEAPASGATGRADSRARGGTTTDQARRAGSHPDREGVDSPHW